MRALFLGDSGLELQTDRAEPIPAPDEILARVLRAGICETDLQLIRGYKGFRGVPGHEFVGVALGGRYRAGSVDVRPLITDRFVSRMASRHSRVRDNPASSRCC